MKCECGNTRPVGKRTCARCSYLEEGCVARGRKRVAPIVIAYLRQVGGYATTTELLTALRPKHPESLWRTLSALQRHERVIKRQVPVPHEYLLTWGIHKKRPIRGTKVENLYILIDRGL